MCSTQTTPSQDDRSIGVDAIIDLQKITTVTDSSIRGASAATAITAPSALGSLEDDPGTITALARDELGPPQDAVTSAWGARFVVCGSDVVWSTVWMIPFAAGERDRATQWLS
jgi:hypothetical protein